MEELDKYNRLVKIKKTSLTSLVQDGRRRENVEPLQELIKLSANSHKLSKFRLQLPKVRGALHIRLSILATFFCL